MTPNTLMPLGLLTLGLAWGASPAVAQYPRYAGPDPYAPPAASYPYSDPYRADRPAYPYGPRRYGQPDGDPYRADLPAYPYGPREYGQRYDPGGYRRPALPEEPPYGIAPPRAGYGPRTYRDSYRPPFPEPRPDAFPGYGPASGGSPQLMSLADSLAGQVDGFLQAFTATARDVPEGEQFLADAQALSAAADRFRQLAASGVPPARLSQELRGIEGAWQRLQQRTQRVARGRTGPNIQKIGLMGDTLQQMRLILP